MNILPGCESKSCGEKIVLRLIAWASVAVGVAAVGLYVGHELRVRYKFNHRTPSDFYAHAWRRERAPISTWEQLNTASASDEIRIANIVNG